MELYRIILNLIYSLQQLRLTYNRPTSHKCQFCIHTITLMKANCRLNVFFNLENYCCLIVDQKPVHVKVFMPIKAKELFIKGNVVKTLMKRKAVKKNFYMYLIENGELTVHEGNVIIDENCQISKVLLHFSRFPSQGVFYSSVIKFQYRM